MFKQKFSYLVWQYQAPNQELFPAHMIVRRIACVLELEICEYRTTLL